MILAFAMTGPGFESYLKNVISLSRSHVSLSVEIWKWISDDPGYFNKQRSAMFSHSVVLMRYCFIAEGGGCMSSCACALDSQPPTSFWEPQCLLAPVDHSVQLEQRYVGRHCPPTIHQALFLAVHSNSIQQHSMNDHMMNYSCVLTCSVAIVIGMLKMWDSLNSWLYHVCSHNSTIVTEL